MRKSFMRRLFCVYRGALWRMKFYALRENFHNLFPISGQICKIWTLYKDTRFAVF